MARHGKAGDWSGRSTDRPLCHPDGVIQAIITVLALGLSTFTVYLGIRQDALLIVLTGVTIGILVMTLAIVVSVL